MAKESMNIEVKMPDELRAGVYTNHMVVSHSKEEFVLDFIFIVPPVGTVTSRVVTSPVHAKRIIAALSDNVAKYEQAFGTIVDAPQADAKLGYH